MIDSTDLSRMGVIQNELEILIDKTKEKNSPILFFANKMDLPQGLDPSQCVDALGLKNITDRSWNIWFLNFKIF